MIDAEFSRLSKYVGFLLTACMMDVETGELKQLSGFEKYDEFMGHLQTVMNADLFSNAPTSQAEDDAFRQLHQIVRFTDTF